MNRRTWCLTYPDGWVGPGDVFHGFRIYPHSTAGKTEPGRPVYARHGYQGLVTERLYHARDSLNQV
jgi:hypothetical protein